MLRKHWGSVPSKSYQTAKRERPFARQARGLQSQESYCGWCSPNPALWVTGFYTHYPHEQGPAICNWGLDCEAAGFVDENVVQHEKTVLCQNGLLQVFGGPSPCRHTRWFQIWDGDAHAPISTKKSMGGRRERN